jgi:putative ABC transport system permease protein
MFSALDAVLIRPLPYPQPESLIAISERHEKWGKQDVSWWNFVDWRAQSKTIGQMAAAQGTIFNLTGADEPERLIGANVSAEFFSILGASPAVGRLFGPLDDRKGAAPVVVLSNSFWRRKLHADPNVAGRALTFNGFKYTIAGVLTSDFRYLYSLDVFAPIVLSANEMGGRASHPGIEVIARIKPGFTLDQVRREMRVISLRLAREYPATNTGESAMLAPLRAISSQLSTSLCCC